VQNVWAAGVASLLILCMLCSARAASKLGSAAVVLNLKSSLSVTGHDDIKRLQNLALGVGWEFEPDDVTTSELKRLGVHTIRCINVDPLQGHFGKDDVYYTRPSPRLDAQLATCREIGAVPHIVIGTDLPEALRTVVRSDSTANAEVLGLTSNAGGVSGPNNWSRYRQYCEAFFRYVILEKGFTNARFEVGNEPDIGGTISTITPKASNGSAALFESYMELYANICAAADTLEEKAGVKVNRGGPALAWAFTFRYGDFNWTTRFLAECKSRQLRLDFIGIHYYGNISSLDGAYSSNFPSFVEMLRWTLSARDSYQPGKPIIITEWGPTYHVANAPLARINASNVGAAWSIEFLDFLLRAQITDALYLVTTDARGIPVGDSRNNVWGWPALFVNPAAFGRSWPKPVFHVFDMISRLRGRRITGTADTPSLKVIASVDESAHVVTVLLWNFDSVIPEAGAPIERAGRLSVALSLLGAGGVLTSNAIHLESWRLDENSSNALTLFEREGKLDDRALLFRSTSGIHNAAREYHFNLDVMPSGVAFIRISDLND
jgi:hypothetical protein